MRRIRGYRGESVEVVAKKKKNSVAMPNKVMNKPYQRAEFVRRGVAGEVSVSSMEGSVAANVF